ncbi:hypothetical protein N7541_002696 [Penicillium brevicompactum]|uniref:Zn(2)-C6 fungal-type domain-containing protein n=1 Tax=Penicillium brevicompactum TaxID=5074 RepID=A0A9W9RKB9_PENBR|nr:hypothetical protein N7541_002696 [Penicillium brevicompactum]
MGPRRTHRKSRNGCPECKRRRLKCDERYPCTNCSKHAIQCTFVERDASTPIMTPATQPESSFGPSPLPLQSYPVTPGSAVAAPETDSPNEMPNVDTDDWASDLELMHHYCTVTCTTLTVREDARHVWRVVLPIEGYSNKYLMHGILALSALHRAHLYPAQREKYIKATAYHQAAGLKQFRELIASPIDPSNWQPVFCFSSMIMVYVCASPVRIGERWPAPILNMAELFSVVKGMQSIMEPWLHSLRKTQLAPLVNSVYLESEMLIPSPAAMQQSLLPPGAHEHLSLLHKFVDEYPFPESQESSDTADGPPVPDHRADYKNALKYFENSTRQIDLAGPHVEIGMVLMWAYSLSKRFRGDLEAYRPPALVLLAYWCMLLHLVEHSWFINGASRELLQDIEDKIHPAFKDWLVWPKRWVFGP